MFGEIYKMTNIESDSMLIVFERFHVNYIFSFPQYYIWPRFSLPKTNIFISFDLSPWVNLLCDITYVTIEERG